MIVYTIPSDGGPMDKKEIRTTAELGLSLEPPSKDLPGVRGICFLVRRFSKCGTCV
jgi:hypothetical protein